MEIARIIGIEIPTVSIVYDVIDILSHSSFYRILRRNNNFRIALFREAENAFFAKGFFSRILLDSKTDSKNCIVM